MATDAGAIIAVTAAALPEPPAASPAIQGLRLTATGSGYYRVRVNGTNTTRHLSEREAIDAASDVKIQNPLADVRYYHDYEVKVELE